ncbi:Ger(x)C family spore germination protein [Metabacillus arenae]|uniref:Ger(X)C family spore germination protein n=1 Tax=Metabacillus arenae TaxID=2771434 RepID=A0A926NHU1_9BACI|nr:Ger(x)C family spore germination protein [Metabacillus arenae]MBD1381325.1 Ger(x)C family spore germination protein [Metabacillus arenae]
MGKSASFLFMIGVLSIFLIGCWDQVEIEDRGFIVGVAIDLVEEAASEPDESKGKYLYKGTWQFVVPSGLSQGSSDTGGSAAQKAFENVSTTSDSILEQARQLAATVSRPPFSQHLQLIIISEEVAKTPQAFGNILDLFLRDNEMRRGIKVLISEGEAGQVLNTQPTPESLPVMYLDSVSENSNKNQKILPENRIGTAHERLIDKKSFVLPKVKKDGEKLNLSGAAVFNGNSSQMIDFINGDITEGLNFITDEYQRGLIKTKMKDDLIVYDIENARRKVSVKVKDKDNIQFNIEIQTDGMIGEGFIPLDYTKQKTISKVEKAIEKEIERKVSNTIKTFQEDLKVDALGLGSFLQGEDYETWKKIRKDWDHGENYFSKSTINLKVKAIVRNSGSVIESEK